MCVKTYLGKGLIVGIVGAVFAIASSILGWVGVPAITSDVARKVNYVKISN